MGSLRSPRTRFRSAIAARTVLLVAAAAAECRRLDLDDALEICLVCLEADRERYGGAASRWLAGLLSEETPPIAIGSLVAAALVGLADPASERDAKRLLAAALHGLGLDRCIPATSLGLLKRRRNLSGRAVEPPALPEEAYPPSAHLLVAGAPSADVS